MAKKNKGFKMKQYKVPPEKYIVVVNPWGIYNNFDDADFNHIGAWFEIMLRDEYPNTRVRAIYYQRTHRNIIVELPRKVDDVEQYLGAHHYCRFLDNGLLMTEAAYMYEYKYATFGDPSDKNWSIGHPMYENIVPNFPVRYPYPLPLPAPSPTMEVPYARALPPELNEKLAARYQQPPNHPNEPGPSTSHDSGRSLSVDAPEETPIVKKEEEKSLAALTDIAKGKMKAIMDDSKDERFAPYIPPSHLTTDLNTHPELPVKKTDSYEDANVRANLLRSSPPIKDEADDFLESIIPNNKEEDQPEMSRQPGDDEEEYKPSSELLALLGGLPPALFDGGNDARLHAEDTRPAVKLEPDVVPGPIVKPEPIDAEMPEYSPSDELLAALAMLPSEITYPEQPPLPIKHEPQEDGVRVKQELLSTDLADHTILHPSHASISSYRIPDQRQHRPPEASKGEVSRDPRIRGRAMAAPVKNKRDRSDDRGHLDDTKRVKIEQP